VCGAATAGALGVEDCRRFARRDFGGEALHDRIRNPESRSPKRSPILVGRASSSEHPRSSSPATKAPRSRRRKPRPPGMTVAPTTVTLREKRRRRCGVVVKLGRRGGAEAVGAALDRSAWPAGGSCSTRATHVAPRLALDGPRSPRTMVEPRPARERSRRDKAVQGRAEPRARRAAPGSSRRRRSRRNTAKVNYGSRSGRSVGRRLGAGGRGARHRAGQEGRRRHLAVKAREPERCRRCGVRARR